MRAFLFAAVAMAIATPAFAQGAAACTAPAAPPAIDGTTASLEDMKAAAAAVTAFIAASDAYQVCEVESVDTARAAAKAAKAKFDNDLAKASDARVSANQKQKEAAGAAFSQARKAFLAAHPS